MRLAKSRSLAVPSSIRRALRPARDKKAFIQQLPDRAKVFDIGCGNDSPSFFKSIRPDLYYVGLDIEDYFQTVAPESVADAYIRTAPENFHQAIQEERDQQFDAIVSAHNLEHCAQPELVLHAICEALRPEGMLYLSFPSEASTTLPSRQGTLNFFDDPTHRAVPVWRDVLKALEAHGLALEFAAQRYRPLANLIIGLAYEPFVAPFGRQAPYAGTWALYGFESVIWARKRTPAALSN
jgi:SAM-dependent methyltransferase